MEFFELLKNIALIALSLALFLLAYFLIEVIRSAIRIRKIIERVEILTDVKSWFHFFKGFIKRKKDM